MNNKLIVLLLPLFFFACETEDDVEEKTIVGSWNYEVTEYDLDCVSNGEVWETGTMAFTETQLTIVSNETFESWCDGTVVGDTCTDEYYGETYTLADFEDSCVVEGGTYADGVCTASQGIDEYTFSDSLYITFTEELELPEEYQSLCEDEGGTYADGVCTIIATISFGLEVDGDTAIMTDIWVDEEDESDSYCDKFVLTRQ